MANGMGVFEDLLRELAGTEATRTELLGGYRLLLNGFGAVERACPEPLEVRDTMSAVMANVVREFADADCVFVRQCRSDGSLEVVGNPVWRSGHQIGTPPRVNLQGEGISGWAVENSKDDNDEPVIIADLESDQLDARQRAAHERFADRDLLDEEWQFIKFIRAEACVTIRMRGRPVGVVVAVRGTPYEPEEAARVSKLLQAMKVILRSLFIVGWILHDFHRTNDLIQRLSRLMPANTSAEEDELFFRKMVTILTSHCGLGWHRAMVFTFDHAYPSDARCRIALGGIGEPTWSDRHNEIGRVKTLAELLERTEHADFAADDKLFQMFKESPRIIPREHFKQEGLRDFFANTHRVPETHFSEEEWFEEGLWLLTPEDQWLRRATAIAPAFEGLAANCQHFIVPLTWIANTSEGLRYRTPGFVILDNPYAHSLSLIRPMPLTRVFCNVFARLMDCRSRPCVESRENKEPRDRTGRSWSGLTHLRSPHIVPPLRNSPEPQEESPTEDTMSTRLETLALDVVRVLQQYGDVPEGFVAKVLGKNSYDIRPLLEDLESDGVLRCVHGRVELLPTSGRKSRR